MDLKLCSKILTDIYIVSNTPAYLFETMRNSPIIYDYLAKESEKDLITEFNIRASTSISNVSEIAELYGVLIALTYKKGEAVNKFFIYVRDNIKFEWFSKISELYLANQNTLLEDTIIQTLPNFNVGGSSQVIINAS